LYLCRLILDLCIQTMTPKDISIRIEVLTVEELLRGIDAQRIVLRSSSTSLSASFSAYKVRSYFIESMFLGMPMIPIVIDGRSFRWTIVDGNKRLLVLNKFFKDKIFWRYSKFTTGIALPIKYSGLSPFMRRRFLNTKIPCYIINPGTPLMVAKEIVERYQTKLS